MPTSRSNRMLRKSQSGGRSWCLSLPGVLLVVLTFGMIQEHIWIQSFSLSTLRSPFLAQNYNSQCVQRQRQQPNRRHEGQFRYWYKEATSLPSVLSMSTDGSYGNNESSSTTKVVYSVFSQSPGVVYMQLLEAAASGNECLQLSDIYDVTSKNSAWDELNEMVEDGDVSAEELQALYEGVLAAGEKGLDKDGFETFYKSIDDLFDDDDDDEEEDDDDDDDSTTKVETLPEPEIQSSSSLDARKLKRDLVEYLEYTESLTCDSDDGQVVAGERRPWGLDCSDRERAQIFDNILALLAGGSQTNLIASGSIRSAKDLTKHILGTWDLRYTSSRTMIINKSLSGLGRSTSDLARNLGLTLTLSGNYYFGKADFVETFGSKTESNDAADDDDSDSVVLKATVDGEWILEMGTRIDAKTGRPSVSLRIEVETIAYGPNKGKAEQWDSLSPIKLVDIVYLDDSLMVVRGNANADALFVYTLAER
eukprot:CAMPEP_0172364698 /NCGR_PEP_ID=MMETSP1060-20121228/7757_1 /TAXON_ID=37318 /ORGANISM="Pseudo-nitzschia pungens, Strain cf. cingulata" /LENGTH=477 /DNA_ID=CAMNT_0013087755 /DNA_START=163 /DNA_END=1599 /DNA_ORIENTATION=+